jgi:hypothetical protein
MIWTRHPLTLGRHRHVRFVLTKGQSIVSIDGFLAQISNPARGASTALGRDRNVERAAKIVAGGGV